MKNYKDEHREWNKIYVDDFCFDDFDPHEDYIFGQEIKAYNEFYNKKEKENMNELELLDKVTDAATFLYVKNMGDSVAPNILVSKLPNKQYYVSLNRYITPSNRFEKTIMFKTTKKTSKEALLEVAKWLSKQPLAKDVNPIDELKNLISENVFNNLLGV